MSFKLTEEEAILLVKLARKAVERNLKDGVIISPPDRISNNLLESRGVFVTINTLKNKKRRLRGCIGFPYPIYPLARAVIEAAVESATRDPRFSPLSISELSHVVFEVSVLTSPQLIKVSSPRDYPSKVKIGVDGLIVERGFNKGLLLPQVPVEWGWDSEEFLCQCCMKAGLTPDCWVLQGTKIYKFSCILVIELEPNGRIVSVDLRREGGFKRLKEILETE
ncbi:TPA: TIGR00296 family protein [Candidatus Bathyarchaeota archaeon]|nr:TIGR00296 family protein [Candidatus Bathyarchaeota archaeon]